jgi:hypothetical protein
LLNVGGGFCHITDIGEGQVHSNGTIRSVP